MNGTKIYEASTKQKIAEIKEDNSVTVQIKKKREDKQLVAKKEGYQTTPFVLNLHLTMPACGTFYFGRAFW